MAFPSSISGVSYTEIGLNYGLFVCLPVSFLLRFHSLITLFFLSLRPRNSGWPASLWDSPFTFSSCLFICNLVPAVSLVHVSRLPTPLIAGSIYFSSSEDYFFEELWEQVSILILGIKKILEFKNIVRTLKIIWHKLLILKMKRMRARKNKVNKDKLKAKFPDSEIICAVHYTTMSRK